MTSIPASFPLYLTLNHTCDCFHCPVICLAVSTCWLVFKNNSSLLKKHICHYLIRIGSFLTSSDILLKSNWQMMSFFLPHSHYMACVACSVYLVWATLAASSQCSRAETNVVVPLKQPGTVAFGRGRKASNSLILWPQSSKFKSAVISGMMKPDGLGGSSFGGTWERAPPRQLVQTSKRHRNAQRDPSSCAGGRVYI